ncbi:MAG: ATP-dependent Clp protease proteolytic subunit [Candidatus Sungbacteria bacterium]|nr:ATP-dependent Clp protease proteolytic subunit [Candidatus Sungbacteria bacterium]
MDLFPGAIDNRKRVDPWIYLAEKKRTLFLSGPVGHGVPIIIGGMSVPHMSAETVVDLMLALDAENSNDPIRLMIDSPGGEASLGLMLYDVMQCVRAPVFTIGRSMCASMAAVILAAGREGHRYAFPNCTMMLHLGWGGSEGRGKERKKREKWLDACDERLARIIIKHCKKVDLTPQQIIEEWDEERELWMFPEQAIDYGLIDKVVTPEIYRAELFPV